MFAAPSILTLGKKTSEQNLFSFQNKRLAQSIILEGLLYGVTEKSMQKKIENFFTILISLFNKKVLPSATGHGMV